MSAAEPTHDALKAENEALRLRNTELERRNTELERALSERERMDTLTELERRVPYQKIFDAIPVAMGVYRRDGLTVAMSRHALEMIGGVREEIIGKFNIITDPTSIATGYVDNFKNAAAERRCVTMPPTSYAISQSDLARVDDRLVWTQTTYVPVQDDDTGEYIVECNIDVTEQQRVQRAEAENRRLQEEIIQIHEESLRALSMQVVLLDVDRLAIRG
jgi:PAS domain S-box-containing protein